ncbi:MAG: thiolase [Rhizobiales bacterium 24-66-13]|jgi:acetyl-CoA acetyltransferase|nr:MAG: thiolase [Rhizobiales bacterium 12-66-7]OYY88016.1 MAG: thiolase [Rhizobiales bacterium 35-66-30]OYZ81650.1 MAG: thiolase [Rhizobiales bacterium 24-66-13]OZB09099.1 MAG: thiolase [Rhizobiales bacterium 39-66-18]HQS09331.1 acetyl-CoA acetyltransferase [Xanthobacteraceae bacterium]
MSKTHPLRGSAAIVGTGLAGLGEAPGRTHLELLAEATAKALDDAGLTLGDVDGLFTANLVNFFPSLTVGEYLGLRPKIAEATNLGGASFVDYAIKAAMAIQAGLCDVALICYGSNSRTGAGKHTSGAELPPHEAAYKPRFPVAAYALAAARHMHEYGTTREDLARVAVAARQWAQLNPLAYRREPTSVEEVLAARMVCDPLTTRDCCLVTDGAGAVIMVSARRARDLKGKPVYFLGGAAAQWHRQISAMPDFTTTAAAESGPRAFAMAGLSPADVDVLQLYDAFTINVLMFLEDLGFCPKGEAGRFVASGAIAPGGSLPVNTNGGGLSCVHPGMYGVFTMIEAAEQLRGTAGDRQVTGAEIALCHGNGGTLSSQVTALFGTASTV